MFSAFPVWNCQLTRYTFIIRNYFIEVTGHQYNHPIALCSLIHGAFGMQLTQLVIFLNFKAISIANEFNSHFKMRKKIDKINLTLGDIHSYPLACQDARLRILRPGDVVDASARSSERGVPCATSAICATLARNTRAALHSFNRSDCFGLDKMTCRAYVNRFVTTAHTAVA